MRSSTGFLGLWDGNPPRVREAREQHFTGEKNVVVCGLDMEKITRDGCVLIINVHNFTTET